MNKAVKLIIGLLILAILFWKFDASQILEDIINSNPVYLFLALILTPVAMHLRALRLQKLLEIHNEKVPLKVLNELGYVSFLFGLVTPSRAGEFFRAYYLSKDHKIPYAHSISTVFIDRLLDVAMLLLIVNIAVIYLPYLLKKNVLSEYTYIMPLLTILFIAVIYLITRPRIINWIFSQIEKFFWKTVSSKLKTENMSDIVKEFHLTLKDLRENKKAVIPLWFINTVLWFFVLLQAHIILLSLGEDVDIVFTFLAVPFAILAALLPITISGIGTRDAAMVALFSLAEVPPSKALSLSLLYLFLGQVVPALVGEYLYLKGNYSSKST